jgi:hypothetical protein
MSKPEDEDQGSDMAIEMLDITEAYLDLIDRVAAENVGALETIGGNILIDIEGVATRTIVTSGPRKGVYPEATETDPIAFFLSVPQWVLLHMLEPDETDPFDLEAAVEEGIVGMEGDPKLYERFMNLARNKRNALSVRMH